MFLRNCVLYIYKRNRNQRFLENLVKIESSPIRAYMWKYPTEFNRNMFDCKPCLFTLELTLFSRYSQVQIM